MGEGRARGGRGGPHPGHDSRDGGGGGGGGKPRFRQVPRAHRDKDSGNEGRRFSIAFERNSHDPIYYHDEQNGVSNHRASLSDVGTTRPYLRGSLDAGADGRGAPLRGRVMNSRNPRGSSFLRRRGPGEGGGSNSTTADLGDLSPRTRPSEGGWGSRLSDPDSSGSARKLRSSTGARDARDAHDQTSSTKDLSFGHTIKEGSTKKSTRGGTDGHRPHSHWRNRSRSERQKRGESDRISTYAGEDDSTGRLQDGTIHASCDSTDKRDTSSSKLTETSANRSSTEERPKNRRFGQRHVPGGQTWESENCFESSVPSIGSVQLQSVRQGSFLGGLFRALSIEEAAIDQFEEGNHGADVSGEHPPPMMGTRQASLLDALSLRRFIRTSNEDDDAVKGDGHVERRASVSAPRRASLLDRIRLLKTTSDDSEATTETVAKGPSHDFNAEWFDYSSATSDYSSREGSNATGSSSTSLVERAMAEQTYRNHVFNPKLPKNAAEGKLSCPDMKNARVGIPSFLFSEHGRDDPVEEQYAQLRNAACREIVDLYSIIKAFQERLHHIAEKHVNMLYRFWSLVRRFALRWLHLHEVVLIQFVVKILEDPRATFRKLLQAMNRVDSCKNLFVRDQDDSAYEQLVSSVDAFAKLFLDFMTHMEKKIPSAVLANSRAVSSEVANIIRSYLWNNPDSPILIPLIAKWMETDAVLYKTWCEDNVKGTKKIKFQMWKKSLEWNHCSIPAVIWEEVNS